MQIKNNTHFDMTDGDIIRQLLQFSWPLIVGNIFQQLYNTANVLILGNYVGGEALAAIGVFAPINNLLLGLFTGISTGATVLVSQYFGARDKLGLNKSIVVALWMTVIGGVLIGFIGLSIMGPILRLIETPEEVFPMAMAYSRIMFIGLVSLFFYNILSGILRGMGDSIIPLLFLIVSNLMNVGLLYLFVVVLDTGITGAAYGTVIAESTAGILTFVYLIKSQEKYDISLNGHKPDMAIGKRMLKIGLPAGLQTSIFSIGFLLQQNLINSFGPDIIAAYAVVGRIDQFVLLPMNSFAIAITTFVGQNLGARKIERTAVGIKKTITLSQAVTVVLVAAIFFFGDDVMVLFSKDIDIIQAGKRILQLLSPGYIVVNTYVVMSGALRGFGDTVAPLLASFTCNVIIRVSLAYILVGLTRNYSMIFISVVTSWALASLFLYFYYKKGIWKNKIHGFS